MLVLVSKSCLPKLCIASRLICELLKFFLDSASLTKLLLEMTYYLVNTSLLVTCKAISLLVCTILDCSPRLKKYRPLSRIYTTYTYVSQGITAFSCYVKYAGLHSLNI